MFFLDYLIDWTRNIREWLYDAYWEVRGWIPPFDNLATPLRYLYTAVAYVVVYLTDFNEWVDAVVDKIASILSLDQIVSYFRTFLDYASAAWDWICNAARNVRDVVELWWGEIVGAFSTLLDWWNSFVDWLPVLWEALIWFRDWWANVFRNISDWWGERLVDIKNFFNSWILPLTPFWEGWQEVREDVFTLLTSPFEWLFSRFEDWFWGKE